jgi:hypothetical protein
MRTLTIDLIFREAWPADTVKHTARAFDRPLDTVRDWIRARRVMSANAFLRMTLENEQLRDAMIRALQGDGYAGMVADLEGAQGQAQGAVVAREGRASDGQAADTEAARGCGTVAPGLMGASK